MSLVAKKHFSGFAKAHDTYNALSAASDGKLYYILSSDSIDVGGQMYAYDPRTASASFLGDLTEICGEENGKTIPQGKSHVRFFEAEGKLYFSTHVGYYQLIDGMDRLPVNPPEGYDLYPGGYILAYDLATGEFERLAQIPGGEGMVSMTMDKARKQIYGISWPTGQFIHLDVDKGILKNLGKFCGNGEAGVPGDDFRTLCRSLVVDPSDGTVYFSTAEGDILSYHPEKGVIEKLDDVDLRVDYFGKYDPKRPGSMGYNWRKILWHTRENAAYGVHGNSGYLFRFDPRGRKIEIVERITSLPSKRSGMFDQFSYGYLGFILGPDEETIYYLTGSPAYENGKAVRGVAEIAKGAAKGIENLHLVTFNVISGTYTDHGSIEYEDGTIPSYVNSIAIGPDSRIYTLARFVHEGRVIEDLISFPAPV
jgi:hypothetical protein